MRQNAEGSHGRGDTPASPRNQLPPIRSCGMGRATLQVESNFKHPCPLA
jgi:hypothetical protein